MLAVCSAAWIRCSGRRRESLGGGSFALNAYPLAFAQRPIIQNVARGSVPATRFAGLPRQLWYSVVIVPPIGHHGCGAASAKVVEELTFLTLLSIVRDGKRQDEDEAEEELEEEKGGGGGKREGREGGGI